jgi:hypothetical protein
MVSLFYKLLATAVKGDSFINTKSAIFFALHGAFCDLIFRDFAFL